MIKTYRFYYDGNDNFGYIDYCAETLAEAEELFLDFCDEEKMPHEYSHCETIWRPEDADYYGNEYWSGEEYDV